MAINFNCYERILKWSVPFIFLASVTGCTQQSVGTNVMDQLTNDKVAAEVAFFTEVLLTHHDPKQFELEELKLNQLAKHLVQQAKLTTSLHVIIIDDDSFNAHPLPNGIIYISQNLYKLLDTTPLQAALLSHEIAHIKLKHVYEQEQYYRQLFNSDFYNNLSEKETQTTDTFSSLLILQQSRLQEAEADIYSVQLLQQAGFNPHALPELLKLLLSVEITQFNEPEKSQSFFNHPLFSSHPATQERINNAYIAIKNLTAS